MADTLKPEISEYKGNKLLTLNPEGKFKFSFGLSKAKMIIDCIDYIYLFVNNNGESLDKPEVKDEP